MEVNFQMRRTGYLVVALFLLLALATAAPSFGQAKQPQLKTQPEYNGYRAIFDEKDPAKKAALGEKFIADFKESEGVPNAFRMTIGAYAAGKNWAKVMTTADAAAAFPGADNDLKAVAYGNAMVAAQNLNDIDKVISYGEKVLELQPGDLNALIMVSSVIPAKLPTTDDGKKKALDRAQELANKGLAGVQAMEAKASAADKPQFEQIEGNLHATLGLVAFNRPDYKKSIQEYEAAVQKTPKDEVAHYYLALNFQTLAAQSSKEYTAAVDAENKLKAARADQPTIDEASAKSSGLAEDVKKYRDRSIDEFAITVAIGGQLANQAKDSLTKMWVAKNDKTDGLEEFIAEKKKALG
jgi:tetratricopeptide (TPR) repeat protein